MPQPAEHHHARRHAQPVPMDETTRGIVNDAFTDALRVMLDALGWKGDFDGTVTLECRRNQVAKTKPQFVL